MDDDKQNFSAFEADTLYRMIVEAARFWLVGRYLDTKKLPPPATFYVYANGATVNIGWGDAAGPPDAELNPMRGKRVRVTFEIEDNEPTRG